MPVSATWEVNAENKRASILSNIKSEWRIEKILDSKERRNVTGPYIKQVLSSHEIEITESSATEVLKHTTTGIWTALEVVTAFCHRAAIAHQLVSCLHEIFFEDAFRQADWLDAYFQEHNKPVGPLHGLPISLKDQFYVRGVETTMGWVGWIGTFQGKGNSPKHMTFESAMVPRLRALGAILYVKTSVPHTLMSGETVNNVIGYTWNPTNRFLSAGGSSGGEGALISLKGSPLGFGTDIGGSIRIPAVSNGVFGLKPSVGRLPYEGLANSMDGQSLILSVVGPMANTIADLRMITKVLLQTKPWTYDPMVLELPWRQEKETLPSQMTFAFVLDDGFVKPSPPVRRALREVAEALEAVGHKVIEWTPTPTHRDLDRICTKVWSMDDGFDHDRNFALSGEPKSEQRDDGQQPTAWKQMVAHEIAALNVEKMNARKAYMDYWQNATDQHGQVADAIISPVAPLPAARPKQCYYYGYTTWVNLLDYTSVAFPVTQARNDIDVADNEYQPRNPVDQNCFESCK